MNTFYCLNRCCWYFSWINSNFCTSCYIIVRNSCCLNVLSISICYSSCIICNLTWNLLSSFINRTICCYHFNKSVTRNFFWLSCKWSCYFFVVYWSCWRRDNVTFFILILNNNSSIFSNNSWCVSSCCFSSISISNTYCYSMGFSSKCSKRSKGNSNGSSFIFNKLISTLIRYSNTTVIINSSVFCTY